PLGGVGLEAKWRHSRPDRTRRGMEKVGGPLRGPGGAAAFVLGRLCAETDAGRILAGPSQPAARPVPVHAAARRPLAARAAGALVSQFPCAKKIACFLAHWAEIDIVGMLTCRSSAELPCRHSFPAGQCPNRQ